MNSSGQKVLPFKLVVPQMKENLPTTPSKRSRSQSSNDDKCDDNDDDNLGPSQKEPKLSRKDVVDDDDERCYVKEEVRSEDDELQAQITTTPTPNVASHGLEEDNLPGLDMDFQRKGRAIKGSNLFPFKGDPLSKQQKQQNSQQQQQKQQNGESPWRAQNHQNHHDLLGSTPLKGSPKSPFSNHHKPGKLHAVKIRKAPHNGQGTHHVESTDIKEPPDPL